MSVAATCPAIPDGAADSVGVRPWTKREFQRWLDDYVAAWRSYDADAIGALFSDDAEYRYQPVGREPVSGRAAIVASWLDERDDPDFMDGGVPARGW